jgi:tetratricopeptide (TPR) repeat protein
MFDLKTLSLSLLLVSCAGHKNLQALNNNKLDGLKYESLKRYDIKRLTKSLNLNNSLAMCHIGQYNEGLDQLKKALDKNLNNYLYWNEISTCYILQKDYTQARKFLNLAMSTAKTKHQKSIVLNNIGVIHLENENYEEAKDHFKKSIELSKRSLTPKYNLSQIYLRFGLYRNAKTNLTQLLKINSHDVDFLNSIAYLNLMQKNYKTALLYFDKIAQEYKTRDDVATNLAMTYFMLELFDSAKKTLKNADKIDKFYTSAQFEILKKLEKKVQEKTKAKM